MEYTTLQYNVYLKNIDTLEYTQTRIEYTDTFDLNKTETLEN